MINRANQILSFNKKNFLKFYDEKYENDNADFVSNELKEVKGILYEIRNTNVERYYYIYKTPDNKIGYLTKQVYRKWLLKNKDEQVKRDKGKRVNIVKFIKRTPYFLKFLDRSGEVIQKCKSITKTNIEIMINAIAEHIASLSELKYKPIGDGYSIENWIKAYQIELSDSYSDGVVCSTSCMREQVVGKEGNRERQVVHELLSNKGKNLQIWGIYDEKDELVGRFKIWIYNGEKYLDRVYCKYKHAGQVKKNLIEENILNINIYRTADERQQMFNNLRYEYNLNDFVDKSAPYMDSMAEFIIDIDNKKIILLNKYNGYSKRFLAKSTSIDKKIIEKCKKCGKMMLYEKRLCEECRLKYTYALVKEVPPGSEFTDKDFDILLGKDAFVTDTYAFYKGESIKAISKDIYKKRIISDLKYNSYINNDDIELITNYLNSEEKI